MAIGKGQADRSILTSIISNNLRICCWSLLWPAGAPLQDSVVYAEPLSQLGEGWSGRETLPPGFKLRKRVSVLGDRFRELQVRKRQPNESPSRWYSLSMSWTSLSNRLASPVSFGAPIS